MIGRCNDAPMPTLFVACRMQQKRADWLAQGHGEVEDVEEKEFFKVGTGAGLAFGCVLPRSLGVGAACRPHPHWGPGWYQTHPSPPPPPPTLPIALPQCAKGEERLVAHFYRNSEPCKVMDMHLARLARTHLETKFVRLAAEKSPFLTGACGACVHGCWGGDPWGGLGEGRGDVIPAAGRQSTATVLLRLKDGTGNRPCGCLACPPSFLHTPR